MPLPHTVLNLGPDCSIKPSDVVRDLGVLLDNTLSLKFQIASITKSCFFHLRRIGQVKKSLNENCLCTLVQALVISRLDYCNSVLYGLSASTLQPLTTVLYCAAKLIKNLSPVIMSPRPFVNYTGFIHSFIHSGHFYSAPSSSLLLRGTPDYSTDTVSEFHAEAHRQL